MLGDRRFALYVITHSDAAGILVRIGDDRWGFARQWFPERGESPADFTPERCIDLSRTAVGDPSADVRLLTRMPFTMVAEVARAFRAGNGFLVGGAAHRMTPAGALGMKHGDPLGAQPGLEARLGGARVGRRRAAGQLPRRTQTGG